MNKFLKIYRWLILSMLIVWAVGCASTGNTTNKWIGRPESELINARGQPDNTATLTDGRKILTWDDYYSANQVVPCRQSFTIGVDGKVEEFVSSNCEPRQTVPFRRGARRGF